MNYENGFYIYTPNKDINIITAFDCVQVIQIIEGMIWLTGVEGDYTIGYAKEIGTIGKMVMSEEGVVTTCTEHKPVKDDCESRKEAAMKLSLSQRDMKDEINDELESES